MAIKPVSGEIKSQDINDNLSYLDSKRTSMADLSQDVKEALTGGAVPIVGENAVSSINVQKESILPEKTSFLQVGENLFDKRRVVYNRFTDNLGETRESDKYFYYDIESLKDGQSIYIRGSNGGERTFRFVTAYDSSGNVLISDGLDNVSDNSPIFTASGETSRVRITCLMTYLKDGLDLMVNYGLSAIDYSSYEIKPDETWGFSDKQKKELEGMPINPDGFPDKSIELRKTNFFISGKNLLNPNMIKNNYYLDLKGVEQASVNYFFTPKIHVDMEESISLIARNGEKIGYRFATVFDINGKVLPTLGIENPTSLPQVYTALSNEISYVVFSIDKRKIEVNNLMIYYGREHLTFEEFGYIPISDIKLSQDQFLQIETELGIFKNSLIGKKLFVFGDSINAAPTGSASYGKMIAERNNMIFKSCAVGGATFSKETNNNIVDQIEKVLNDSPDYILLNGGTNDILYSTLGNITENYDVSFDTNTFSGAMEFCISTIKKTWPKVKLLFVRVHNMSSRDSKKQLTFGERALEICRKWSVDYVDLYNSGGLNTNIENMRELYTIKKEGKGDGTHPNDQGYKIFYVPKVENKLRRM